MATGEPAWWHDLIGIDEKDPTLEMTDKEMKSILNRTYFGDGVDTPKEFNLRTEEFETPVGTILNNTNGDMYVYNDANWEDMTISAAPQLECHLQLDATGIKWIDADGVELEVTNELINLRKEIDYLKGVIAELSGAYRIAEFNINGISLVANDEYPIQESEGNKFDRAMKGVE